MTEISKVSLCIIFNRFWLDKFRADPIRTDGRFAASVSLVNWWVTTTSLLLYKFLVGRWRLELQTFSVSARLSNQLIYRPIKWRKRWISKPHTTWIVTISFQDWHLAFRFTLPFYKKITIFKVLVTTTKLNIVVWSWRGVTIPLPMVYKTIALPTWATPAFNFK